jgi:hypothetical protein
MITSSRMIGLVVLALSSIMAAAQEVSLAKVDGSGLNMVSPGVAFSSLPAKALPEAPSHGRFWDTENRALFVTAAAFSAADFAATRSNLQNGGRELNPVTRVFSGSTAGLAMNFVGETAGVVGLSYYFHRIGHHRLERLTPLINIAASAFAVAYDLAHR